MKILAKLRKLEEEIPNLRGKKREKVMKMYRALLRLLKDEPIYLVRYE
jgi:hypothetical protein